MLDLQTALAIFGVLEAHRYDAVDGEMDGIEPIFDVRLDATTNRNDEREYRIRATPGAIKTLTGETWQMVIDLARGVDDGWLTVDIQNSGMELRS